jgi:hypothetical protein
MAVAYDLGVSETLGCTLALSIDDLQNFIYSIVKNFAAKDLKSFRTF